MTFGERIRNGVLGGALLFAGETGFQLAHVVADEKDSIIVAGVPIEFPPETKKLGSTYTVENACLYENPDNAGVCLENEKKVLMIGHSIGSVRLADGSIFILKGERGDFSFIDEALAAQADGGLDPS
jgi:hypothetical protein